MTKFNLELTLPELQKIHALLAIEKNNYEDDLTDKNKANNANLHLSVICPLFFYIESKLTENRATL